MLIYTNKVTKADLLFVLGMCCSTIWTTSSRPNASYWAVSWFAFAIVMGVGGTLIELLKTKTRS